MRNLRERLSTIAASEKKKTAPNPQEASLYMEEHIFPLASLMEIEKSSLKEVLACDPYFIGKEWRLDDILFLDTETTGLSGGTGTYAFEVGIGIIEKGLFRVRQYVMRDYPQEKIMLLAIAELLKTHKTLVSFNGKSFDIPLLESRMVVNGIHIQLSEIPHLDLMHVCRRIYKLRLKRCNLQTLERAVLGMQRLDDLPGAEAPQRYFQYLRTGEFALLKDVLNHNLEDVVSLAKLTGHVAAVFRMPETLTEPEDLFSVGRVLERTGLIEQSRKCYRILQHTTLGPSAKLHLAVSYKKAQNWDQTISVCEDMIKEGQNGIWPYIEMAKYQEHVMKDYDTALAYATKGLSYLLNRLYTDKEKQDAEISMTRKRIERLLRKQYIGRIV